jgi:hypothetical protein
VPLDGAWLPHRHLIEALMSYVAAPGSIPVAVAHSKSSKPLERLSTQGLRGKKAKYNAVADRRRNVNPQQDLQYYEIAEILNLSMGTAMSKLFYARKNYNLF